MLTQIVRLCSRPALFVVLSLLAHNAFAQHGQSPTWQTAQSGLATNYSQQLGSYASYGPTPGMNMDPTQSNPFIGSWFGASPTQDGSARIVSFTEFLPNGNSRATSIIQGGSMNGTRMQAWGKYAVKQLGPNRYQISTYVKGFAPRELCMQGGTCQQQNLPMSGTEIDEMLGPDKFHSRSEMNGHMTDMDITRSPTPQQLLVSVGPRITLNPPPQNIGGGGNDGSNAPTMPTLHPYVTPGGGTYRVPGQGGTWDDAQQNRICTINNGHMYTNSQGCRICAGPN